MQWAGGIFPQSEKAGYHSAHCSNYHQIWVLGYFHVLVKKESKSVTLYLTDGFLFAKSVPLNKRDACKTLIFLRQSGKSFKEQHWFVLL